MNKIYKYERWQLIQKQSVSLEGKIIVAEKRIQQFYEKMNGDVFVAFSGGKDSTVLLHLVRSLYPRVPAVFSDTGLEYPEIIDFVKSIDNVLFVRPKKSFKWVIENEGFPVISKKCSTMLRRLQNPSKRNEKSRRLYLTGLTSDNRKSKRYTLPKKYKRYIDAPFSISEKCCYILKKEPMIRLSIEKNIHPFIGVMANDSEQRAENYLKHGCNIYEGRHKSSRPLSIWNDKDVWNYINKFNLSYSKIYDMGEDKTGCVFCMFGVHMEKSPNRFQRMKQTHPKLWDYCMDKLKLKDVLKYMRVPYEPDRGFFKYHEICNKRIKKKN